MWEVDHKEGWAPKNWCFWTVVLEKTLERVLWTARRSNQSILKEINPDYSLEKHVEAEAPILWPLNVKRRLTGKDPDAGKDWGQEEKGTTEDEMVGWHHWLNGWVWANSGRWWKTGKSGMLQLMGLQRIGHDFATEKQQQQTLPKS